MTIDNQLLMKVFYYDDPRRPYGLFIRAKKFVDALCTPIF